MAHSNQAKKRLRQSEKQRLYNKSLRSEIKTLTKTLIQSVEEKDLETASAVFRKVVSRLDKAVKVHVYHKNTAARRKSKAAALHRSLSAVS